jgi:outer membrane protein assembly factor BamB
MARWPVVALVLVLGCGSEMRKTGEPRTTEAPASAPDGGMIVVDPTRPEITVQPPRGAPHYAVVQATAISLGGTAALSRDAQGEVRIWPALDGTVAPRAVAVRGVLAMRVQDHGGEILAGFAESSGVGHLVRLDRKGQRVGVAEIVGPGTVLQVSPLGDASGALALFADHSIGLVDRDGVSLHSLSRRGMRLRALEVTGPGLAFAVIRQAEGDGTVRHTVARIEVIGGKLALTGEVALPLEPLEPMRFAVSRDGKRIAYTRDPDDAKAKVAADGKGKGDAPEEERAARGAAAPRRPPPPPRGRPTQARVAVIDTATGADVTPAELHDTVFNDVSALGFSSPDRLHVFDATNQDDIRLAEGVAIAGRMPRSGGVSIADGLLLTGFDVSLVLQSPDGDTRYLGWQTNLPQRVAMAPDGARAAWASQRGELMIESLDGSQEIYGGLYEAPIHLLSFVGSDHVIVGSGRGTVHLVDARTGKERGSLAPPGPLHNVDIDGDSGWLAGTRTGGGVWMVKVDPAASMPSTTMVVADGSQQFGLHTTGRGADPELITIDSTQVVRRYTVAELAAGVSAKAIRERPTTKLPRSVSRIDRRGRTYVFEGRKLVVYNAGIVEKTHLLAFDPVDLAVSPDGEILVVFDRQNALTRIDSDGKPLWTATMGPGGRWSSAFSSDGTRLGAVGSGGGVVFDTATGERVTTSCAWRFGASASPPLSRAVGVAPLCQ